MFFLPHRPGGDDGKMCNSTSFSGETAVVESQGHAAIGPSLRRLLAPRRSETQGPVKKEGGRMVRCLCNNCVPSSPIRGTPAG